MKPGERPPRGRFLARPKEAPPEGGGSEGASLAFGLRLVERLPARRRDPGLRALAPVPCVRPDALRELRGQDHGERLGAPTMARPVARAPATRVLVRLSGLVERWRPSEIPCLDCVGRVGSARWDGWHCSSSGRTAPISPTGIRPRAGARSDFHGLSAGAGPLTRPSAGTPVRTALVFLPSGHLLCTMIRRPRNRGNSR